MSQFKYYWEDFAVGSVRDLGQVTVTAEEIKAFAAKFDPQPFHLDEEAGRRSIYGELCASGWHTCSLAMKLMVENFLKDASSKGSPGLENVRWLRPVFAGDTLSLRHRILESKPMRKRADTGLVRTAWEMSNQKGEPVMRMEGWGMFGRRHPAMAEEIAQREDRT